MRLLILGGSAWLGSTIATAARDAGNDVTCLARGESGALPDGVRAVISDRREADAYRDVVDQDWDGVVDVTRQPGQARAAVAALAERAATITFVSSLSVYADHSVAQQDEAAALLAPLESDELTTLEDYGSAKVACERAVVDAFGTDRAALLRVGLMAGPGDTSDRSGYWPARYAFPSLSDGSVLVPDAPGLDTQVVDVRDLAAWIIAVTRDRVTGTFNVAGPTLPFAEHVALARSVARHTGPRVLVDQDWLLAHDVAPWAGPRSLPLWLPLPDYAGFSNRSTAKAQAAGFVTRPVAETLRATLAWERRVGVDRQRSAGLAPSDERDLIIARRG